MPDLTCERQWSPKDALWMLEDQRERLLAEADEIVKTANRQKRVFTSAEDAFLDWLLDDSHGELAELTQVIEQKRKEDRRLKNMAHQRQLARSPEEIDRRTQGDFPDTNPSNSGKWQHKIARLEAFPNTDEGARDAYYVGNWLRAIGARCNPKTGLDEAAERVCESRGWTPQAAATEGTDTAGGFLVPRPLSNTLISIREDVGVTRRVADIVPMSSKTEDIPKRSSGLTVFYPGEANTITTSDLTFGRVNLVAIKRAVANQISSELAEDALINMTDRAVNEMGYALADKEDDEFLNGDATSSYGGETGLLTEIGSAGIYTPDNGGGESVWTGITNATIAAWFGTLPSKYFRAGQMAIICSMNFYFNVFYRLLSAAGGNTADTLRARGLAEVADAMYSGIPIFFTDKMPTATAVSTVSALFGNFKLATMLGDRTGVRIGLSVDYAFLDDVTTLLATSRYDINVHEPGDATDAGGFVGLQTAAS